MPKQADSSSSLFALLHQPSIFKPHLTTLHENPSPFIVQIFSSASASASVFSICCWGFHITIDMEHFYAGDGSPVAPYHRDSSERAIFDATQYEFFGKNVVEHELGGLEDKKDDVPLEGIKDEGFSDRIWLDKDKGEGSRSSSNIYDLTNAFSKLNRAISKPRNPGDNGERVSSPMEGSYAVEWTNEADFSTWIEHHILDTESFRKGRRQL